MVDAPSVVAPAMLNEASAVLPPTIPLKVVVPEPLLVRPKPPLTVEPKLSVPVPALKMILAPSVIAPV